MYTHYTFPSPRNNQYILYPFSVPSQETFGTHPLSFFPICPSSRNIRHKSPFNYSYLSFLKKHSAHIPFHLFLFVLPQETFGTHPFSFFTICPSSRNILHTFLLIYSYFKKHLALIPFYLFLLFPSLKNIRHIYLFIYSYFSFPRNIRHTSLFIYSYLSFPKKQSAHILFHLFLSVLPQETVGTHPFSFIPIGPTSRNIRHTSLFWLFIYSYCFLP